MNKHMNKIQRTNGEIKMGTIKVKQFIVINTIRDYTTEEDINTI